MKHRSEIDHLRHDIETLKANGSALARDIRHDGGAAIRDSFGHLKTKSRHNLHRIEDRIREKPGQTLALGLIGGVVLSYILARLK